MVTIKLKLVAVNNMDVLESVVKVRPKCTLYLYSAVVKHIIFRSEYYKQDKVKQLCSEDCSAYRGCCCFQCHCCFNCTASCSCPFSTTEPDSVIGNLLALTSGPYRWGNKNRDIWTKRHMPYFQYCQGSHCWLHCHGRFGQRGA